MSDPNLPAFPTSDTTYGGITKREYFAGQALGVLLTRARFDPQAVAKAAYQYADAMLGTPDADAFLDKLRENIQTYHDVIKPNIVMGDDDSIHLTDRQEGMKWALQMVLKAIDAREKSDG